MVTNSRASMALCLKLERQRNRKMGESQNRETLTQKTKPGRKRIKKKYRRNCIRRKKKRIKRKSEHEEYKETKKKNHKETI